MKPLLFPPLKRPALITAIVIAVIAGAFAVLMGAVTHTGGIDGGATGLVVSILAIGVGSAAAMTIGGVATWLGFALAVFGTHLALGSIGGEGDAVGTIYTDLSATWSWWIPIATLLGAGLGVIVAALCGNSNSGKTLSAWGTTVVPNRVESERDV